MALANAQQKKDLHECSMIITFVMQPIQVQREPTKEQNRLIIYLVILAEESI